MLFLFSVRFIRPSRKGETFLNPQNGPIMENFACISSEFFYFFLFQWMLVNNKQRSRKNQERDYIITMDTMWLLKPYCVWTHLTRITKPFFKIFSDRIKNQVRPQSKHVEIISYRHCFSLHQYDLYQSLQRLFFIGIVSVLRLLALYQSLQRLSLIGIVLVLRQLALYQSLQRLSLIGKVSVLHQLALNQSLQRLSLLDIVSVYTM